MYARFVVGYFLLKREPHQVCITIGGDKRNYTSGAGFLTDNMLETKILVNSTILYAKKGS